MDGVEVVALGDRLPVGGVDAFPPLEVDARALRRVVICAGNGVGGLRGGWRGGGARIYT